MNISLIEFLVYGFFAYSSVIVLVLSIRDPLPLKSKRMTLVRSGYMIPGILFCFLLAGSGVEIYLESGYTEIIEVYNGTDSSLITNSTHIIPAKSFTLQNPMWGWLHILLAFILIIYVLVQILQMFIAKD